MSRRDEFLLRSFVLQVRSNNDNASGWIVLNEWLSDQAGMVYWTKIPLNIVYNVHPT